MSTSNPSSSSTTTSQPQPENFEAYLPHLTILLDSLTTSASSLPLKSDLAFHKTLDRKFGKGLDQAADQVLEITGKLLRLSASSSSKGKGKASDRTLKGSAIGQDGISEDDLLDRYKRTVVESVNGLLEDADSRLDELSGRKKKAAIDIPEKAIAAASQKLPGPASALPARGFLPSHLRNDTTIPKPQLQFSDPPNNATNLPPWKPTLPSKPHAMVPLDFEPPSDTSDTESEPATERQLERHQRQKSAKQKARGHPYWYETQHLPYPTSMFTATPPIAPLSMDETSVIFVDTPEALSALEEALANANEVAVDLEHHDMRSYHGFTCLIQISTRDGDWIVDALKLRTEIRERKFGNVFADPSVVKVFHGADSDIVWLQQDFDIYIVNLFDTYHATVVLGMNSHSLAGLLSLYCNFTADKRYQMADWRIRPLGPEMLHYARADTHFLLFIYDNLRNALLEKSSRPPSPIPDMAQEDTAEESKNEMMEDAVPKRQNPQEAMRRVLKRSSETALRLYEREEYRPLNPDTVGKRWLARKEALGEIGWVFSKIHAWRDNIARQEDESPFYIMPNLVLANLSRLEHPSIPLIRKVTEKKAAPAAEKAGELYAIIRDAKAAWSEGPPPEWISRSRASEGPHAKRSYRSPTPTEANAKKWPVLDTTRTASSEPRAVRHLDGDLDLWTHLQSAAPGIIPQRINATSRLFGTTTKVKNPPKNAEQSQKVVSSLFGSSLANRGDKSAPKVKNRHRAKSKSPGFESVMAGIHAQLGPPPAPAPAPAPAVPVADSAAQGTAQGTAEEIKNASTLPEPETVPFVPSSARSTLPSGPNAEATTAPAEPLSTAEIKSKRKDEVVSVRRKGKKRDRQNTGVSQAPQGLVDEIAIEERADRGGGSPSKKTRLSDSPPLPDSMISNGATASAAPSDSATKKEKKPKKEKKAKLDPKDIPDFDYSKAPNLLDHPVQASSELSKKGKKDKKKRKEGILPHQPTTIEVPRFGSTAPKDMTAPKGGNRSGTFTK